LRLQDRTHLGDNRYEATVSLDPREEPPALGTILPALADMGVVIIAAVRPAAAPWRSAADRTWVVCIETLEDAPRLPDLPTTWQQRAS